MEVELELAVFVVYKDCIICFWACTSGKFNQIGLRKLILGSF